MKLQSPHFQKFQFKKILVGVSFFLLSQEARVSQVMRIDSSESLAQLIDRSAHIVVVKAEKPRTELFKKVVFPKETQFKKDHETVYQEDIAIYKVDRILKSTSIKAGEVKVWAVPAYGEESARAYHESDISESPIERVYKALNEPSEKDKKIIFLQDYFGKNDVYILNGIEGFKSASKVEKLLNVKIPK